MLYKLSFFLLLNILFSSSAFAHRALVEAPEQSVLSSAITSQVIKISFRSGESFKKGDILLSYDCKLIKTQKEKTEVELVGLKAKAQSYEKMFKLNSISELDYIMANSEVSKKEIELKMANITVSKCEVIAPYDGKVLKNTVHEYDYVGEQKELMSIVGTKELELIVVIPIKILYTVSKGQKISFISDEKKASAKGIIVGISPSVDPVSQTVQVRAKLTSFSGSIIPGVVGDAQLGDK